MTSDDIWPPREVWVGRWLLVICALVVAMILVGGATRLTDSGLSITEWDLGKGLTPPLTESRWSEEFALYQRTVEFQEQNSEMTLAEFQYIYWWEWGHRFLGKVIGVAFALPALFFFFTGRLRGRFRVTLALFALGALQGAIGWWMVTSGLFSGLDVSPIRLAIHLGVALIILALALWVALGAFAWPRATGRLGLPRWAPFVLMALVFAQVMLGALLAGSRGGAAYADWPWIGGEWIPPTAFGLEPLWANFTEDHATQHLLHRTVGYVTALAAVGMALAALARGRGEARWTAAVVGALALAQAGLGVLTVISASPLSLSLAHQAGAVALWMAALAAARAAWR
ncbi:MAG: COX15/CtaA family protein [Hyphomonadaceae bacterium]|nr:COX15/CtaA family protein [Hyphomonadaceae bacterium]